MTGLRLGIDIGGTKVAFALGDETGHLRARQQRPTEPSGSPEADLVRMAADLLAKSRMSRQNHLLPTV